jgi:oligoribonuclease NrnB/cAMP/cGMP phosphodiesterase (DHH superfamily)
MPPHIFKDLNAKLLKEKEEINEALCEAKDAVPEPIDYRERVVTFRETLEMLKDPSINASVKNMHLKDIIEKIEYDRPPNVKITNENKEQLGYGKLGRKNMFHSEPFEISIFIR